MFKYIFPITANFRIIVPDIDDSTEVKILSNTTNPDCTHTIRQYSTGIILETTTYKNRVLIECNKSININFDGTYIINC